jgi:hypothetical protein
MTDIDIVFHIERKINYIFFIFQEQGEEQPRTSGGGGGGWGGGGGEGSELQCLSHLHHLTWECHHQGGCRVLIGNFVIILTETATRENRQMGGETRDETQDIREKIWGRWDKRRLTNYEEQDVIEEMRDKRWDERWEKRGDSWYLFLSKRFMRGGTKFESLKVLSSEMNPAEIRLIR